jgi:D-alanyl-D-alanine carboxypeptidase
MAALPALRLNGATHELIVRRTRAGTRVELRRKQDGALLAHGAGRNRVALAMHAATRAEARRALRALAPRAAGLGLALSLRTDRRARTTARATPTAAVLAGIPASYGAARDLARVREPRALESIGRDRYGREQFLAPAAARAWLRMRDAARAAGIVLELVSAFRSAAYQAAVIARKVAAGRTLAQVLEVNAAPGFSEHHAGRAIDVSTPGSRPLEEEFESTDAFRWLAAHAGAFGFRLSFPRGNRHGIAYEPWHWFYTRG